MENQEQEQEFTEWLTCRLILVNPSRNNNRFVVIGDVTKIQHSIIFSPSLLSGLSDAFHIINERMFQIIRRNASLRDGHSIYVRDINNIFYETTGYEINKVVKILGCSLTKAVCDCLDKSMSININRGYIENSNDYFSAKECANITQNREYMKNLRNNFRKNPNEFKQDFFKAFNVAILGNINPYVLAFPENSDDSEVDKILQSVINTMVGHSINRDILKTYYTNIIKIPMEASSETNNPISNNITVTLPNIEQSFVLPVYVPPTFTPFSLSDPKSSDNNVSRNFETKPIETKPMEKTCNDDVLISDDYVRTFLNERLQHHYPVLFKDRQALFRFAVNDCIKQKIGFQRSHDIWETNVSWGMQFLYGYKFTIKDFMKCLKRAMPEVHAWIYNEIKNDKTFPWPDIQK